MDERALTERLIRYDTSDDEGIRKAAGFVKGWLESRDIPVEELEIRGLPVLAARVGSDHRARRWCSTATSMSCPRPGAVPAARSKATGSSDAARTT